ncbi:peptidoglycan recognition protein [Streptomyces sp. SR27]|uniref:peptidoglycan recognition protein family protein n=1 Tax=Streptomyces sp. SR27 TaxID=3076630 RepID=UPI00295B3B46|nr:peptidoglycan recognition protein [Streptomyces sp. SR27]MDV9188043.1 peptidoglycan recognition protein [Streptomyces sp. SR27]
MIPQLLGRTGRRAATVAGLAAVVLASTGLTATTTAAAPTPVPASPAADGSGHGLRSIRLDGTDPVRRALPSRTTEPFSMIGLTWTDPRAELRGTAEVRTRDHRTGAWSAWRTLDLDVRTPETGLDGRAPGVRAGTQPLWTGPSNGVQVRVTAEPGTRASLPKGLRVELVDPMADEARAETRTSTTLTANGQPAVTPRSGWGADESLVLAPPTYTAETKAVFVHHTAGTNDYTCDQSAAIIRAIFLYHVQGQGWNDIGYQFLVDKCGTVFEGRAGGIDKPVLGAQTYGFNTDTTGIAVLGNYNEAVSTAPVLDAIAGVAAWKLGLYGYDPAGTVNLVAAADNGLYKKGQVVTLNRISGHRDGYPTECPGANLYADLPTIRQLAVPQPPVPEPTAQSN